jgi:hypothetical protein
MVSAAMAFFGLQGVALTLEAVKTERNKMLRTHHSDKASTDGAQPDDEMVMAIYEHYEVLETAVKKKSALTAEELEEKQRRVDLHRARFCEQGDKCAQCLALCMAFADCQACYGFRDYHSCPPKKDWTIFLKAFPDDELRTDGFQILAHEGYAAFMRWKISVKKVRESEEEVQKLEAKLLDKKKREGEKRQAVQSAKGAVEDAIRTAIQNSPMKKELLKDRRFQGMMSIQDDDSDTVVTDNECTLCNDGLMKKGARGFGCSNWKPNDPDNSCSNFKPFHAIKRQRR